MILPNVYELGFTFGQALKNLLNVQSCSNSNGSCQDSSYPNIPEIWNFLIQLPYIYKEWWWNLVTNDPIHVAVETTLLVSVVYMSILSRNKDYRSLSQRHEGLSLKEQEDLLQEWKESRSELAPVQVIHKDPIVVHAFHGRTMEVEYNNNNNNNNNTSSTTTSTTKSNNVKQSQQNSITTVLNMATYDFLSMSSNKLLKDASRDALQKYGCGSCGPRGFYGTIDVHLQLEQAMANFTKTEGAIMYSDGASTITSTIAAFAKRGDLLVVDDGVYEPIVTGVTLSRANVEWFQHNNMQDLRRVLEKVRNIDKELGRKPCDQRRFIVVEGLYKNTGTIVPFDELAALKHEFNFRVILDESFSFGTLGSTGKGVLELYQSRHMYDAEIVTVSLENSLGSIGGITVGNEEVVDHQRLSGAGYCFSASSPPFTASAAISALHQLDTTPEIYQKLQTNIRKFHEKLKSIDTKVMPDKLVCTSDPRSAIIYFEINPTIASQFTHEYNVEKLNDIVRKCLEAGIAIVSTTRSFPRRNTPCPAIRINLSSAHTEDDLDQVLRSLEKAVLL